MFYLAIYLWPCKDQQPSYYAILTILDFVMNFPSSSSTCVGARNRLQDLSLSQRRADGVFGRAAEMQIQTGHTGGLRVLRTQSPKGDNGQNPRLLHLSGVFLTVGTFSLFSTVNILCLWELFSGGLHAAFLFLSLFAETVMSFLQLLTDKLSDRYSFPCFS